MAHAFMNSTIVFEWFILAYNLCLKKKKVISEIMRRKQDCLCACLGLTGSLVRTNRASRFHVPYTSGASCHGASFGPSSRKDSATRTGHTSM